MLHKVLLSPMDQFMPSRHVRVILAFSSSVPEAAIISLNSGLDTLCAQIPYLKGFVYQSDHQGYLGVSWSDDTAPVKLQEVSAPDGMPTYAELVAQGMPDRYLSASMFPADVKNTTGSDSGLEVPVLRVLCAIIQGGFLLCIYFHHNVMDGAGVADLLNIWAINTRSDNSAVSPKILDDLTQRNALLKDSLSRKNILASSPNHEPATTSQPVSKLGSTSNTPSAAAPVLTGISKSLVTSRLFVFEPSKLDILSKALAPATSGTCITKNTIISALVWSRVSLIRSRRRETQNSLVPNDHLRNATKSSIIMTVNLRRYVFSQAEPQELFLGNLLTTIPTPLSVIASTLSDLTTDDTSKIRYPSTLPQVTSAIAASYCTLSSQRASSMYSLASNMSDVRSFRKARALFNGNDLIVTSWMNFLFYPDFGPGIGTPAYVRLPDVGEDAD